VLVVRDRGGLSEARNTTLSPTVGAYKGSRADKVQELGLGFNDIEVVMASKRA